MPRYEFKDVPDLKRITMAEVGLYEMGDQAPRRIVMVQCENSFEAILGKLKEAKFPIHGCDGFRVLRYQTMAICQDIPTGISPNAEIDITNVRLIANSMVKRVPCLSINHGIVKRKSEDPLDPNYKRCIKVQDVIAWHELQMVNKVSKWFHVLEEVDNFCEAYMEKVKPVMAYIT